MLTTPALRAAALALALLFLLPASGPQAQTLPAAGKHPALSSHLLRLTLAAREAPPARSRAQLTDILAPDLRVMIDAGFVRLDENGRVQVYVEADDSTVAARRVASLGGAVERLRGDLGLVQAAVPLERLPDLATDPAVRHVRLPDYGLPQRGLQRTEGDTILEAARLRNTFGPIGTGIKVGVISDGVRGLQSSQASGDLPAVDIETCNVVRNSDPLSLGAEATAMLEIIHDLAPGARLFYGNYGNLTSLDFMAAVDCLSQHVDVIVDDIAWFNQGPYDGSSAISLNTAARLNDPLRPIRAYFTSAGNFANKHYSERFEPCASGNRHRFAATARTLDPQGVGPRCSNPLRVGAGATAFIFVQWDDPRGASCNDYDIRLLKHDSNEVLASSANPQTCLQDPTETIIWRNDSNSQVTVDLVIERRGSPQPRTFDVFMGGALPAFYTPAGSIPAQADAAGGVITVGAIDAHNPGQADAQVYSSRGPTRDGRLKPDLAAVDCVSISGAGGFASPFCGTSAAAPHAAAIAALLLSCNRALLSGESGDDPPGDRAALLAALLSGALDRGPPGPDNTFGYGLVNAIQAGSDVCVARNAGLGDVNCDRSVDTLDALLTLRFVANVPPFAPCAGAGDVDCDAAITLVDVLMILRHTAGLPPLPTPEGCPAIGLLTTYR